MIEKRESNLAYRVHRRGRPRWPTFGQFNWGLLVALVLGLLGWVGIIWLVLTQLL